MCAVLFCVSDDLCRPVSRVLLAVDCQLFALVTCGLAVVGCRPSLEVEEKSVVSLRSRLSASGSSGNVCLSSSRDLLSPFLLEQTVLYSKKRSVTCIKGRIVCNSPSKGSCSPVPPLLVYSKREFGFKNSPAILGVSWLSLTAGDVGHDSPSLDSIRLMHPFHPLRLLWCLALGLHQRIAARSFRGRTYSTAHQQGS